MKTTFTKTELVELVSIFRKENAELKEQNLKCHKDYAKCQSDLGQLWDHVREIKRERDQLEDQVRQLKSQEQLLRTKISRLRTKVGSQEEYIDDVVWFGWNFPYYGQNFIEEVWKEDKSLANHIRDKFSYRMSQDDKNGFYTFLSDLDDGNRHRLYEWVVKNYSKSGRVRQSDEG